MPKTTPEETEALGWLAETLGCSQCGRTFDQPACGPTHALIAADPRRHRLIAPLIEAAQVRAWDEGCDAASWRSFRRTDVAIGLAEDADPPNPYRFPAPVPQAAEANARHEAEEGL